LFDRRAGDGRGRRRDDGGILGGHGPEVLDDDLVKIAVAQGHEHGLVLLLHHLAHDLAHALLVEVLGVGGLGRLQDAATIHEKMRDDVRVADAGVLRLHMEHASLVPDVVVEPEER
jgi:hypothetical protein